MNSKTSASATAPWIGFFRTASVLAGIVAVTTVTGCGEPPHARFELAQETRDLLPPAEKGVSDFLSESFGSPMQLVAWQRYPIDYGVYEGSITQVGDSTNQFSVELADTPEVDLDGASLLFTGGNYAGNSAPVRDYDPETGLLTLDAALPDPADAESTFAVGGMHLQSGRKLYMTHCMHCHGVSGDGQGPTAPYLNPPPRDYRPGVFKFTSTGSTDKVRRDDLERVIRHGIPGTYMPSFMLLKDDEMHDIVEYVRWLSMRGETERRLDAELSGDYSKAVVAERVEGGETEAEIKAQLEEFLGSEFAEVADTVATDVSDTWAMAQEPETVVLPKVARSPDTPESRARGRQLYLSGKAKCATCHGHLGLGNGPETESFKTIPGTNDPYPHPGLYDDWGNRLEPRNLTTGIYRGGRRPLDIYRRIYAGIKGAKMPAFGGTVLTDEEIWDLVNYVMSIPYDGAEIEGVEADASEVAISEIGNNE